MAVIYNAPGVSRGRMLIFTVVKYHRLVRLCLNYSSKKIYILCSKIKENTTITV
jgi:hypothetical protein